MATPTAATPLSQLAAISDPLSFQWAQERMVVKSSGANQEMGWGQGLGWVRWIIVPYSRHKLDLTEINWLSPNWVRKVKNENNKEKLNQTSLDSSKLVQSGPSWCYTHPLDDVWLHYSLTPELLKQPESTLMNQNKSSPFHLIQFRILVILLSLEPELWLLNLQEPQKELLV